MMKKYFAFLGACLVAVLPEFAGAAGTYYNNNLYQQRYGNTGNYASSRGYGYASTYGQNTTTTTTRTVKKTKKTKTATRKSSSEKQGLVLDAGVEHQLASWKFDMNTAKSKLHYDNLMWNVIGAEGTYYFGDSTPMQIKVGGRYGVQYDESPMVDDDISQGGYGIMNWTDESGNIIGTQSGHALSVGTSKGGTQFGFNAAFGLTDFFTAGRVKITPSVGYRYLKYKLTTKQNYGVAVDIFDSTDAHPYVTCISGYLGEIQCDPFLLFYSTTGAITITGRVVDEEGNLSDVIQAPGIAGFNIAGVGTGGTYYYEQSGTSHEYETTWAGPYVALDAEYEIDSMNTVTAGVELGLPIYTAEGNQPYRYDWAHPKSVEDKSGLGDAIHLGLNANWITAISDSMSLSVGFTYDYYSVSKATANTYLNSTYYLNAYDAYEEAYTEGMNNGTLTEYQQNVLEEEMAAIEGYQSDGWKLKTDKEINSVYRSMGIRVGVNVKF